jgi:hypothetical protein
MEQDVGSPLDRERGLGPSAEERVLGAVHRAPLWVYPDAPEQSNREGGMQVAGFRW